VNKKITLIVSTIAFGILIIFSHYYTEANRVATQEMRILYFSILATIIIIALHFLKKHPSVREMKALEMLFDSLELLMIVATPMVFTFDYLTKWYPEDTQYKLVFATITIFSWFIITMYRTSRIEDKDASKITNAISILIYACTLFFIMLGLWFIIAY